MVHRVWLEQQQRKATQRLLWVDCLLLTALICRALAYQGTQRESVISMISMMPSGTAFIITYSKFTHNPTFEMSTLM